MDPISTIKEFMMEFAETTGLADPATPPRRYLWTDAFGLCNFLELYRQTKAENWRNLALSLVDQVHDVLGRHREDDARTGFISGLTEEEGRRHPTAGGLRIGKTENERGPGEPYDEREEWDRDGQYFHYLTKWMHALNRAGRIAEIPMFTRWAIELAKAAHAAFVHTLPNGSKRIYWKMRIDLSAPLVPSMGQQDALDGLITYSRLQASAGKISERLPSLGPEIAEMAALCRGMNFATEDPLGIGMLLCDAYTVAQLMATDSFPENGALFNDLLLSSLAGLHALGESRFWELPADHRLAFRELGTAIGLHAIEKIKGLIREKREAFGGMHPGPAQMKRFDHFVGLGRNIEAFWLESENRKSQTWIAHRHINGVMLATSLAPNSFL